MKRFQWLILLCAFMLAFTSCAWAEDTLEEIANARKEDFVNAYDTETGKVGWTPLIRAIYAYESCDAKPEGLKSYYAGIKKLDLSGESITDSNYDGTDVGSLAPFTGLEELNLSNTNITNIGGLSGMNALKSLDLSGNKLENIGALASKTTIESLNISNTDATHEWYGALVGMRGLKKLDISRNPRISSIGPLTKNETSNQFADTLEELNVSETGLAVIQEVWGTDSSSLPKLKTLYARNLNLTSISGLVMIANVNGFNSEGITWDLGNSTLTQNNDNSSHVSQITSKFTDNQGKFTVPTVETSPKTRNAITINGTSKAMILASNTTAREGETISVTIAESYKGFVTALHVVNGESEITPTSSNGGFTFTMPASDVTLSADITKKDTLQVEPQAKTGLTYTGKAQELIEAGTIKEGVEVEGGTLELKYAVTTEETEPTEYTTGIPTGTGAGTYHVYYKVATSSKTKSTKYYDNRYNSVSATKIDVEIAKNTPTYTAPTGLTATVGQKLSEITLPTGWTWVDSTTEIKSGDTTFKANFTPTDIANYKIVENVDVTVTVSAAPEPDEPATTEPELTLKVTPTTATLKEGKVGEVYSDDLKVRFKTETTPADKTITWTAAANLPADLKLDTATGIISGTPKEATPQGKPHEIKITVTATSGDKTKTAEVTATLTVTNTGSTTPTKPEDTDTKTDETKQTEQEKEVETAIDALSSDSTVELTKEQVSLIVNAIVEENSKVELTSEQVNNLVSNILSGDTASSLSDTQVQTLVEKTVVSADGTLDSKVMETITSAIETANENALTATDIASGTGTAAKMVVTALTKSVEKSSGNELKLKDVPLTSMNGIATLLTKIADGISGVETKNITLDLSGMGSQLTKIDHLDGVDVKEMKLEDTAVTGVDLSKATIETVSMKNSKVTELKLGTDSNVTNINANGSKELSEVSIEGNKNIKTLDISGTNVSSLNAEECEKLETLTVEGGTNEGEGALQNLNLEGCKNLKELTVSNNKLLGVKKPDNMTNSNITFRARGQKRSSTDFKLSRRMNLWKFLWAVWQASLEADDVNKGEYKAESHDIAPFDVSKITSVTTDVGQVTPNASGDVEFTGTPSSFTYEYDPGFTTATPTGFMTAEEAQKSGMDVTIDASSDDGSSSISSSGGGCDAGFSFGALSALMLVFATLRKRR